MKCIDASTGMEKWKTRGFGEGTLMLADGHLIILGDRGKLGLVKATASAYHEVAERRGAERTVLDSADACQRQALCTE